MKFNKELKKFGSSLGITIPNETIKLLNLKEGDFLQIEIKRIGELKNYKCLVCNEIFAFNSLVEEDIYCSTCDNEDRSKFEEVMEVTQNERI